MESIIINPLKEEWPQIVARPVIDSRNLERTVSEIIREVRQRGDDAVKEYSYQFSGFAPENLWVTKNDIRSATKKISPELKKAILTAKRNIEKFHEQQVEKIKKVETMSGVVCWRKSIPIERVGLYIPGGSAPLFSTLLMLGIPAKIAGCKEIIVATPPQPDGSINEVVLFVAGLLGIDKIYKAGGAQAIAAMAYGTHTMDKVYKIFGPGNQYVTCAKKLVNNEGTAIDMLAGPSEVAIYADQTCMPEFVAADLLSQAEHGADSQVVLVATKQKIIQEVMDEIEIQLPRLARKHIIEQCFLNKRFIVIKNKKTAFDFLNAYAPEHLIIASEKADSLSRYVVNAGSVFLGNYSPESAGDYASGTNHSLPTNGTSVVTAGVSVDNFVKKITFQRISHKGIKTIGNTIEQMAEAEGLQAHRNAVSIRIKKKNRS
ncbi:MAG TPA: histidinol dehydrogenase [Chitinophagaceae bacterium]|nr:histidinol dehydrogenase [Chitinophagaceae bacterium]